VWEALKLDEYDPNLRPSPVPQKPISKAKSNIDALKGLVSKEDDRPAIQGVFHDTKHDVATDSYILVAVPVAEKRDKTWVENPATGEIIDNKFPNWQSAMPKAADARSSATLTQKQVYDLMSVVNGYHRVRGMNTKYDKTIPVKLEIGGNTVNLDMLNLNRLLNAMLQAGADGLKVSYFVDYRGSVLFEDTGKSGVSGIIMPYLADDTDASAAVELSNDGVKYNRNVFEKAVEKIIDDVSAQTEIEIEKSQETEDDFFNGIDEPVPFHSPRRRLSAISQKAFERLIEWLKKTGLATNVFVDAKAMREVLDKKGIETFAQIAELSHVNARFNKELQQQIDGTLPAGHIYSLGNAGAILQAAGLPDLPIELAASRLSDKSMQENHPFDLSEIKDLPKAIQNPMAVFRSATHIGSFVVLTEITHNGKNFVAAIEANRKKRKIEVNDIRSIHYRTSNAHFANWIDEGLTEYVDKQKMVEWFSKQRYNSAEVRNLFNRAAKVIKDFENPNIPDENLQFMIAWHGSPNTFPYFSNSMNGTGEGDSGWGYGTYLSKDKVDAKDYALKLARGDGQERLYKVEIPNKERYLDLSKPLSEQSKYVKEKLRLIPKEMLDRMSAEMYEAEELTTDNLFAENGYFNGIKGGKDFFGVLENAAHSEYDASEFLYNLGISGNKHSEFGAENYIVFNADEIDIKSSTRPREIHFMATSKGEIYGFATKDGKIYIDPNLINANTPIHEFGHLFWSSAMPAETKAKITELLKKTKGWKELSNNPAYANLKTDDEKADELFNTLLGNYGEYNPTVREIMGDDVTLFARIQNAINEFLDWLKAVFGNTDAKLNVFAKKTLDELLGGERILSEPGFSQDLQDLQNKISSAEREADTNPTEAQKKAEHRIEAQRLETYLNETEDGKKLITNYELRITEAKAQAKKVSDFIKDVLDGKIKDGKEFIDLPEQANRLAEKALGHPIESHSIHADEIRHINKNHGTDGKKNTATSIPLRSEDIALLPYIMGAPDRVEKGNPDVRGVESVRYYKNLSNGYVVVVEREGSFSDNDMEAITMWAETKSHSPYAANARNNRPSPERLNPNGFNQPTRQPLTIVPNDATKIRKDFESAVEKEEENKIFFQVLRFGDPNVYFTREHDARAKKAGLLKDISETNPDVTENDYWLATKGVFGEIELSEYENIDAKEINPPGSKSFYKIKDGVLYRKSDHWGKIIATCSWLLANNKGVLYFNTGESQGIYKTAKIKLSELKRKQGVVNIFEPPKGTKKTFKGMTIEELAKFTDKPIDEAEKTVNEFGVYLFSDVIKNMPLDGVYLDHEIINTKRKEPLRTIGERNYWDDANTKLLMSDSNHTESKLVIAFEDDNFIIAFGKDYYNNAIVSLIDKASNREVGMVRGTRIDYKIDGQILSAYGIDSNIGVTGKGYGTKMYEALRDFSDEDIRALVSLGNRRQNFGSVPRIWDKMGAEKPYGNRGDYFVRLMSEGFKGSKDNNDAVQFQISITPAGKAKVSYVESSHNGGQGAENLDRAEEQGQQENLEGTSKSTNFAEKNKEDETGTKTGMDNRRAVVDGALRSLVGSGQAGTGIEQTIAESNRQGSSGAADSSVREGWNKGRFLGTLEVAARKNGSWIDDVRSIAGSFIGKGYENEVYRANDGKNVIKINNLNFLNDDDTQYETTRDFDYFIERLYSHNQLFPKDRYQIIGFAENSNGEVGVVLIQPYVYAPEFATMEQIEAWLDENGFEEAITPEGMKYRSNLILRVILSRQCADCR
jgi:hypothetical protein